nr:immunoglobulin light chain junction region [Macaca mulatta]
CMQGRQVPYTF